MGKLFIFPDEPQVELTRRATQALSWNFTAATEMCGSGNTRLSRPRQHQPGKSADRNRRVAAT
jgi:hypothetical protein